MSDTLRYVYGDILVVRPPVPATCNKAGANYKSEVEHLTYSPQRAFDEWVTILDGIAAAGGDALFDFEAVDDPFLDHDELHLNAQGQVSADGKALGHIDDVMTGRVFTANGPWVTVVGKELRAVMPHMLPHRRMETPYYRKLLEQIADACKLSLTITDNPHRWEGMADVAVVGDKVVLTYAVPGHYDAGTTPKSQRSSKAGCAFAADSAGVPEAARIYAELVYPHFHGDTVHFGARPPGGAPALVHYPNGLWQGESARVQASLGGNVRLIEANDAVEQYAGNSRQVRNDLLVPDGVSQAFIDTARAMGLKERLVPLFELFGKAGGGPACATLYLPANLQVPQNAPFRYSNARDRVTARRARLPRTLRVDKAYFAGRQRG